MEKMLYLVWKPETDSEKVFRDRLLGQVAPRIIDAGAHHLRVGVVDEDVTAATHLRIEATKPPVSGMVSVWVDTSVRRQPIEKAIQASVSRMAGYLVTESEPIVNTRHVVPDGQRTPGMYQVVLLRKPPRLNYEHWLEIWLGSHTQVAIDTQSTFGYRQNVIVRPLTYAAPPYDAIIEELFPAEAMTDTMVFYNAVGDEAKRKRHEKAMIDSVVRFIDFDKMDRIPMSEYTIKSWR
ncbi:MAG: EthD domain-containing protein [Dehalococcoidia bacterium]|nr:EthD domain-containing protein [Dehalococcoidia bacterium]